MLQAIGLFTMAVILAIMKFKLLAALFRTMPNRTPVEFIITTVASPMRRASLIGLFTSKFPPQTQVMAQGVFQTFEALWWILNQTFAVAVVNNSDDGLVVFARTVICVRWTRSVTLFGHVESDKPHTNVEPNERVCYL